MPSALRIGLTGGIGSGKSAVSKVFSTLGATIIDTDLIARELVQPGEPAYTEIVNLFGANVLDAEQQLDRARLRKLVFSDPALRLKLESILHPHIRERALEQADASTTPYSVLVIPLLVETAGDYLLDRVLVIDTPVELQRQRVKARDRLQDADIDAILAAQSDRQTRLAAADDILLNDGDLDSLAEKVRDLHRHYLEVASKRH